MEAFRHGILCKVLDCPAVCLCFAVHPATGKILVIVCPAFAFVVLEFGHCLANLYLIPVGLFAGGAAPGAEELAGMAQNVVAVTLGDIVGGGGRSRSSCCTGSRTCGTDGGMNGVAASLPAVPLGVA